VPSFALTLLLVSCLSGLVPLTVDIFLPAMPSIAVELNAPVGEIQFSLATLNLGIALGHLLYGALSDRYGRKPVVIGAMALYSLCAVACLLVAGSGAFSWLRFLQGLAAACSMVLSRAIVRDRYDGIEAARMYSYMFVAGALAPILAPIVGGYVTASWGGMATFYVVAAAGFAITVLFAAKFDESYPANLRAVHRAEMPGRLAELAHSSDFVLYTLITTATFFGLFAILTGLSPTLIGVLGVSPTMFGYMFATVMLGNFTASYIAGRIVNRVGIDRMIVIGALVCLAAGAVLLATTMSGIVTAWGIVAGACAFMVGFALINPAASAGAMSPFARMAGRASMIMGLLNMGAGAAMSFILGLAHDGTHRPLIYALAASSLLVFVLALLIRMRRPTAT
jgi:DHA1 family bicyclomycin/chloramphenicol resistance-like MFS transporter